jgi:glycosyltransferase involved in cell wall biosynthesis
MNATAPTADSPSLPARRPRIGVDFHTYDGKFQGSRSHLLGLYREAVALAPEIDFVFFVGDAEKLGREHPAFRAPNVTLVSMPRRNALLRLGWQLPWLQRTHRLDLLHMQYRLPLLPAWLGGGPCACTIHDVLFETHPEHFPSAFRRLMHWTGQHAVRHSALLFAVSRFTRDELARLYGADAERIALTCNGVDAKRFRPGLDGAPLVRALGLKPGEYLCTVGRIEPRKNHLNLLRAYARVHAPRPPLVIVGQPDPDFGEVAVRAEVRALGLENDVVFLEHVSDQELPALIRHAKLFLYPSFAEGFGMPVLEAMASGVAVITSNTTSLPEVAGDAALTVDPHDSTELSAAILCLLADPRRRALLAERGLQQAQRFTWRASAQSLVGVYRQHFAEAAPQPLQQRAA